MSLELRNRIFQGKSSTCTARLLPKNVQFLDDWVLSLSAYKVRESALMDLCVSIVRSLYDSGKLSLSPTELCNLLQKTECLELDPRRNRMARLLADAAKFRITRPESRP